MAIELDANLDPQNSSPYADPGTYKLERYPEPMPESDPEAPSDEPDGPFVTIGPSAKPFDVLRALAALKGPHEFREFHRQARHVKHGIEGLISDNLVKISERALDMLLTDPMRVTSWLLSVIGGRRDEILSLKGIIADKERELHNERSKSSDLTQRLHAAINDLAESDIAAEEARELASNLFATIKSLELRLENLERGDV